MSTFDFTFDLTLENKRVELRPLAKTDIAFLLPFSLKEPALWDYSITSAAGEEALTTYVENAYRYETTKRGILS